MPRTGDPFGWVGATLDEKLRIDAVAGEGGFGVVYRGHHLGFDAPIAFKCLKVPAELVGEERERFRQAFIEEGRLLHRLSRATNGIVQALDVGTAESPRGVWTPYLVLEWLEGQSLEDDLLERRRRGLAGRELVDALALLEPAVRALGVAHRMGVAHRDVKPANLFITTAAGQPTLKVLDFGIAKVLTETESVTRALAATGGSIQAFTPKYGAPEQFARRYGATGPWTDVFALALTLVEVVTARDALDGDDTGQLFVCAVDESARPSLRARGAATSDAVETVMSRALAVYPRDRFPDADAFWKALREAAGNRLGELATARTELATPTAAASGVGATEIARSTHLAGAASGPRTTGAQVVSASGSAAQKRGRRWPMVVTSAMLLAAIAVVASRALRSSSDTSPTITTTRHEPAPPLATAPASISASSDPAAMASPPASPMVTIAPETFEMGRASPRPGELRAREVTISRPFRIDVREVRALDHARCVTAGACSAPSCATQNEDAAVTCVSREQSHAYCRWAGKRLPTEAEWELAAQKAERLGLDAMSGGVAEWVADAFERDLGTRAATDPFVPWSTGMRATLRGGSTDAQHGSGATSASRVAVDSGAAGVGTGFRCAADVDDSAAR